MPQNVLPDLTTLLFEQAHDMILIHGLEGQILRANPIACRMLGYTQDEMEQMNLSRLVSREHSLRIVEVLQEIPQQGALVFDMVYVERDGGAIPVEISAVRMQSGDGPVIQSVARNIRRRLEEEQRVQRHVSRLVAEVAECREQKTHSERLTTIGQLTSSVSHELRNPLGVLNNSVYFLSMILDNNDQRVAKHLRIMKREIEECRRLVDELLEFSRDTVITRQDVNLAALIDTALARIDWAENVQVAKKFPSEQVSARVDSQRIVQVFVNLFSNAIQAMPNGGKLSIALEQGSDAVAVHVQDTGIGIESDVLPRIFEPLFTTKPKGIGLGLAVCKRLVELHDGTISVQSTVQQGSTFTVRFPRPT